MRIGVVLRAGDGDNLVDGVVADARAAEAAGLRRYVEAGAAELIVEASPEDRDRTWALLGELA